MTISDSLRRPQDIAHLIHTAQTFSDIAKAHFRVAEDRNFKFLSADLMGKAFLAKEHLSRVKLTGGSSQHQDVYHGFAEQLKDLFTGVIIPPFTLPCVAQAWDSPGLEGQGSRLGSVQTMLAFGESKDDFAQLHQLINDLTNWEARFSQCFPEDRSLWVAEDLAITGKSNIPSTTIREAAKSVSKALVACHNCSCLPEHHFGASICLRTYQKIESETISDGEVDFDMFLTSMDDWQQVRMRTAQLRKKAARFAITEKEAGHKLDKGRRYRQQLTRPVKIKSLCEPLSRFRMKRRPERLDLKLDQGELYSLSSEKHEPAVDVAKSPVSLQQYLLGHPQSFTDKARRILPVILSYSVLHLHDTPWLQSTWDSSDIIFFHTRTAQLSLTPFLRTNINAMKERICALPSRTKSDYACDGSDSSGESFDPDDGPPQHQCPAMVALAMTILEICFTQTFDKIADVKNVAIDDDRPLYLIVDEVFQRCEEDIPSGAHKAIDECFNLENWQDADDVKLGANEIWDNIYEKIVRPLELDLGQSFSHIDLEDLDRVTREIDLSSWSQVIRKGLDGEHSAIVKSDFGLSPGLLPIGDTPTSLSSSLMGQFAHQYAQQIANAQLYSNQTMKAPQLFEVRQTSPLPWSLTPDNYSRAQTPNPACQKFFDDEMSFDHPNSEGTRGYIKWRDQYFDVYNKFVGEASKSLAASSRVKIAVLDTGIDFNHDLADHENLKKKRDFLVPESHKRSKRPTDSVGHGTFVTSLLCEYAMDAEVYVAKIADRTPSTPEIVAQAIEHAINVWNVDIISMSFGWPDNQSDGYNKLRGALKHAVKKDVLVFAAASNDGGRLGRAFPAREHNVICVHSTDWQGNPSPFNPTPLNDTINFATVGQSVESAWPLHLCDDGPGRDTTVKSGTSFATPIMAGIAAMLLTYARLHLPADSAASFKEKYNMEKLLKRIATKSADAPMRGGHYFVDLNLHGDSLFGKEKSFIDGVFEDILKA